MSSYREYANRSQYEQSSKQATCNFKLQHQDSFEALVFMWVLYLVWRKNGEPGENSSEQGEKQQKSQTHMASGRHRTRARRQALSPLYHPCSPNSFNKVLRISLTLCTKLTYLSTASVHEAFDIHANSACTFIKNSKLRLMVE